MVGSAPDRPAPGRRKAGHGTQGNVLPPAAAKHKTLSCVPGRLAGRPAPGRRGVGQGRHANVLCFDAGDGKAQDTVVCCGSSHGAGPRTGQFCD